MRRLTFGLLFAVLAACNQPAAPAPAAPAGDPPRFWVYRDTTANMPFVPYGWMPGEAGQMLKVDEAHAAGAHEGRCLLFEVNWRAPDWFGVGFFCGPAEPAWWGDDDRGRPIDLSAFDTLVFWARGENGGESLRIEVGSLAGKPFGDSLPAPVGTPWISLTADWRPYELDLSAYTPDQRRRIAAGLTVISARDRQPAGTTRTRFYLDTVYYEMRNRAATAVTRPAPAGLTRLREALATRRWAAYTATEQNPVTGRRTTPTGIRADLETLRPLADAIVTYSHDARGGSDAIVPIAAELGILVVPGIWDVRSPEELAGVVAAAKAYPDTVPAILVGNETQLFGRADSAALKQAIDQLRTELPDMPLSTSEPPGHLTDPELLARLDFLAPNIHWVFAGGNVTDIDAATAWLSAQLDRLKSLPHCADKPVLLKESGLPSGPAPYSRELQARYWRAWFAARPNTADLATVIFEAFDAPWKPTTNPSEQSAIEANWGAFTHQREAKPVVAAMTE